MDKFSDDINFDIINPPAYLKDYVKSFWSLESFSDANQIKAFGPLADGCPGVLFQPKHKGRYFDEHKMLPEFFLYGQTISRTQILLSGNFQSMGISFQPHALKSVFGFNANEITDSCLDLTLCCKEGKAVSEKLLNREKVTGKIDILIQWLLNQIQKNKVPINKVINHAVEEIIHSNGELPLKGLQQKYKLSERSIERKFNEHVGIPPKLFIKICRFQSSLQQLKIKDYNKLSDIAYDNGFADQSHFIRNFKNFAGYSPLEFQKQPLSAIDNCTFFVNRQNLNTKDNVPDSSK